MDETKKVSENSLHRRERLSRRRFKEVTEPDVFGDFACFRDSNLSVRATITFVMQSRLKLRN